MEQPSSQVLNPAQPPVPDSTHGSPLALKQSEARPKIHVLFLIDQLTARGGGEGNLLKLVQVLPPELVRCSVATFRIHPKIRKSIEVPVHVFPMKRVFHPSSLKGALALRRLIRREQVDIVQTYFETSNLWGGIIAKLSGAALLSSRRDLGILRQKKHRLAYRLVNRAADRVLAVSEEVKKFCVEQEGIAPEKVSVVYNGVDLRQFAAEGRENPFAGAEWAGAPQIVTCLANLRRIKGIDVLVRAAEKVCREFPQAVFLVAGALNEPPAYTEEIRQMVRSLGLEKNVKLLGFVEDPRPLLRMSNAFCLLSRSEGFSNALLEAMACGVPAVMTSVGGNPEALRDGENCFLVAPEDHQAAADRLIFLLRDPAGAAARIGQAARETVHSRFSADAMVRQLLKVYGELMAARKPRKKA